jgi:hypothetical protein
LTWNDDAALDKVFRQAAKGTLIEWGIEGEVDDLVQNLWKWYLERPSTQQLMADLSEPERIVTARHHANQIISGDVLAGNLATGKVVYSTDAVKEALEGISTNKYLLEILHDAREALAARNELQAEALRSRYEDGVFPVEPGKSVLKRAVKSLTDEVNIMYLTSDDDGIGRREAASPNTRKGGGGYSDPTSGIALALMRNPNEREAFYAYEDFQEWERGVPSEDAVEFPVNIMDAAFNGIPHSEFYRAQVFPELFPNEPRMLVENWQRQDREMFCGPVG